MKQRTIFTTLAICVAVLLGVNLLMERWSHRLPYYQKLERIRLAKENPSVLFIGNSLLDTRIDSVALNKGGALRSVSFTPLNAAFAGSDPHDQALAAQYAIQCHPGMRTLVVGFFDFQLTGEHKVKPLDLAGNHLVAVDPRFPVSVVASIYHFDQVEAWELRMLRAVPMAANRSNVWKYVELLRRTMGEIGMPHQATNGMGRASDFAALEADSPASFDAAAQTFLRNPSHFNASYEHIFALAAQAHMRVVLVVMPISPDHQSRFYARSSWKQYLATMHDLSQKRGFTMIDASSWMSEADQFSDALHMTMPAASKFSLRLGAELVPGSQSPGAVSGTPQIKKISQIFPTTYISPMGGWPSSASGRS